MPTTDGAFQFALGCNDCCTPAETCITVIGCCGAVVAGATVTVERAGVTVDSGTTDATGEWCTTLAADGDTVTIEATGYETREDLALNAGHANAYQLFAADGYCCGCGAVPLPATTYLNDSFGEIELTAFESVLGCVHVGCALRTYTCGGARIAHDHDCQSVDSGAYSVEIPLGFVVVPKCPCGFDLYVYFPVVSKVLVLGWPIPNQETQYPDADATCADFLTRVEGYFPGELPATVDGVSCDYTIWRRSRLRCRCEPASGAETADPGECDPLAIECDFTFQLSPPIGSDYVSFLACVYGDGTPTAFTWTE